jgi:cytochrome c553
MPDSLKRVLALGLLLGSIGGVALLVNLAATPTRAQAPNRYLPHLGDLMNQSMQVHHTKLWLAGHAGNWRLAAYEVSKLKETIELVKEAIVDIQKASAKWQRAPIGDLFGNLDSQLNALERAVKAKDSDKFETAYRGLTATCNACHSRVGESQIKIMVPTAGGTYVDQDFTAGGGAQ